MRKKDPTGNSEQLGNLLLRYKKIFKPPQESVLIEVARVVSEVVGVSVSSKQFNYTVSSKIVYIKTPSLIKSEIIKKKADIKKALSERLGEGNVPLDFI